MNTKCMKILRIRERREDERNALFSTKQLFFLSFIPPLGRVSNKELEAKNKHSLLRK